MDNDLLCSIIMPVYNAEKFLKNTLNSVLNQTIKNFELICVNDCSTDNSEGIVKEFQGIDSRIKLINNEKNSRVSATRNNGILNAKSAWVALIDADDAWEPTFLEEVLNLRNNTNADIVCSSEKFMSNEGELLNGEFIVPHEITYKKLLKQNVISCSAVLVRKQLLIENPFFADEVHEDYLCWLNLLKYGIKVVGLEKPLSIRRLTVGSKSRNKFKAIKMSYMTYKKHGLKFFKRCFYTCCNAVNGLKKYSKVKGKIENK